MRHILAGLMMVSILMMVGCGGSEEATLDDQSMQSEQTADQGQAPPKEEKPMDQALTSFIGDKGKDPAATTQATPAVQPSQLALYEKQIEDLRTENTSLKQKIVKLEQDNRTLNSRLADNEGKITTEKIRADRAEEALKNALTAQPISQPAPTPAPVKSDEPTLAEPTPGMNITGYEDALKAFNGRKYSDALQGFQNVLSGGIAKEMEDNCAYWIGESQFALKKYKDALASFQNVMKFKNSEKKGDAEFMLAQTYEKLGNKKKAKESYEKVVKDYPMSKNVKRAKERWAKL